METTVTPLTSSDGRVQSVHARLEQPKAQMQDGAECPINDAGLCQGRSITKRSGRKLINTLSIFGISVLMSFVSSGVAAKLHVWPRLRVMEQDRALALLVTPHMFLRFIGLSFLVPGVVSPSLPAAFAIPAGYGDLVAGILAIVATLTLVNVHAGPVQPYGSSISGARLISYSRFIKAGTCGFTRKLSELRSSW
jgi:hypothetical protein